jgi:hypothetical protein
MATRFVCHGADKEDLTELVEVALATRVAVARLQISRVTFQTGDDRTHRLDLTSTGWKVIVKCSQGHKNVFEGS